MKPLIFLEDNVRAVSIQETMCVLVSVCVCVCEGGGGGG